MDHDDQLRSLRTNTIDVRAIVNDPSTANHRFQYTDRTSDTAFMVRTYQARSGNSGISIRADPENGFLSPPGFLIHGTTAAAANAILEFGLRTMDRNAIHLSPIKFTATQSNYVKRKKTHILIAADANQAIVHCYQSPPLSPNGVVFCDGNEEGVAPKGFLVAAFCFEPPLNSEPIVSRLDLNATRIGRFPISYFHGPGVR